jgi:TonB family protein
MKTTLRGMVTGLEVGRETGAWSFYLKPLPNPFGALMRRLVGKRSGSDDRTLVRVMKQRGGAHLSDGDLVEVEGEIDPDHILEADVVRPILVRRLSPVALLSGLLLLLVVLLLLFHVKRSGEISGIVEISWKFPATVASVSIAKADSGQVVVSTVPGAGGNYRTGTLAQGHYLVIAKGPVCKSVEQAADIGFFRKKVQRDFLLEGCSSLTIQILPNVAEHIRTSYGARAELVSEQGIKLAQKVDASGLVKWSQLPQATYTIILQDKPWKKVQIGPAQNLTEKYGVPLPPKPPRGGHAGGGAKPTGVNGSQIGPSILSPSQPKPIGGHVQNAKVTKKVQPAYPATARQRGIQGMVRLSAIIGTDGRLHNIQVVSGHPMLTAAAVEAVKQWVYEPTLLNGQPVDVPTSIDLKFSLQ